MKLLCLLEDTHAVPDGEHDGAHAGEADADPAVDVRQEHEDEGQRVRAVTERRDERVGAAGVRSDVETGLQSSGGLERSHVRGDEQADGEHNDAHDEATEPVVVHDRGDEHEHVGRGRKVTERNNLVAERLQCHGEQQHDRDEDERERKGHGMADTHGGVEADVDLAALGEMLLHERRGGVGDGEQALHEQRRHTRDEHEHGTEGDAEAEDDRHRTGDVGNVEVGDAADDEADDRTHHERLTEDTELLLHGLDVEIDVAHAGDLVDDPVDEHGDGRERGGEAMGQRHTGHAKRLLDLRRGDVTKDEHDDHVDDGRGEAEHDVAGDDRDDGTGEGEVPVVPDVDVDRLRGVRDEHEDVHEQAEWDDEHADGRAHGDGRRRGPAHIDDVQGEAEAGRHLLHGGCETRAEHVVDDQVQADEANADGEAGLEALTKAGAQDGAEDGEQDRHHDVDA